MPAYSCFFVESSAYRKAFLCMLHASLLALTGGNAEAATIYWDGASADWKAAANWSTASGAITPNPSAAPGTNDDIIFNISGANGDQTITLGDANRSARSIVFQNTATTTLTAGGTTRTLSLSHGGLDISASAGAVTLGDNTAGNNVLISLGLGRHTWTNQTANAFTINNTAASFSRSAGNTLTFNQASSGVFAMSTTVLPNANGIVGPWAFFGTGSNARYAVNNAGTIAAYSSGTAANDVNDFTTATTNYDFSTSSTTTVLGGNRTANTARYTGTGHTIDLGASGANTLTINGLLAVGSSGTILIQRSGGTGTVTAGPVNELVITGTQSVTFNAPFSGSSKSLTYINSGTLTLTAPNTHTGTTTVGGGGTLILKDANALQSSILGIANGSVVFDSSVASNAFTIGGLSSASGFSGTGYDISLQNNLGQPIALTINNSSGTQRFYGAITGSGSLIKNGSNATNISGPNSYTGGTIINGGSLGSEAAGNNTFLGSSTNAQVTVNAGASLSLNNNAITGTLNLNGGKLATGNSFQSNWYGSIVLGAGTTSSFDVGNTGGLSISAVISGSGGLTKLGATTSPVALNGDNTFSGPVSIQAGALAVTSLNRVSGGTANSQLGAPTTVADGTISFGSTTTTGILYYRGNGETTDRVIKLAGTTGGATIYQGGSAYLPTTRGQSGLLKFTSDLSVPGSAGADNRKTLTLTHENKAGNGQATGQGEISGSIGDSLLGNSGQTATSIVKAGSGTWVLSGINTYTGSTQVQAGVLAFSRPQSLGSGALDISTGAKVRLDYLGTRQVSSLTFQNGSPQPNGTYGSYESLATFKDDTRFAGLGTITVGPLATSPTVSLALSNGSSSNNGGTSVTYTATVTGGQVGGLVLFYDGLTLIGAAKLNYSYQAVFTTSQLTGGSHSITAVYVGHSNSGPGYSNSLTQTVTESRTTSSTTLARTSGADPSAFGSALTFTATVSGTAPTGTVSFYDGNTLLGTATLNGSGQASISTSGLPTGWRPITASYQGDAFNTPSTTSSALFHTVKPPTGNGKLKVFILAGQSNMQGKSVVETGRDPNNYAITNLVGGMGSLRHMLNKNPKRYGYLADPANPIGANPGWLKRSDVSVAYWSGGGTSDVPSPVATARNGDLDPYFGNNGEGPSGGNGRMGPEYAFGLVMGSQLDDQVLLIKYSFGGKSLGGDYRPPTAVAQRGGTVGPYYTGMVSRVNHVLNNLSTYCPSYTGGGYEISGFAWHQGWNDRISATYTAEYEANLTNLIQDLRTAWSAPNMPVVIGTTSMANVEGDSLGLQLVAAQKAVANPALHPEFAGTVATVDTRAFDYGTDVSPSSEGFHWNWNSESYFNIGETMGQALMGLLANQSSEKDIVTFSIPGQTTASISGNTISVTLPYGTDVTALIPDLTLSALATVNPIPVTPRNFTSPQVYTVTAQNLSTKTYTVTVNYTTPPFNQWASTPGLGLSSGVNDNPLMDPDGDSLPNLLEFILSSEPMNPASATIPVIQKQSNQWVFEYARNDASLPPATTQIVQYSEDLTNWTDITIPATSSGNVNITPGSPSDQIRVTIPDNGNKVFVRLKAVP